MPSSAPLSACWLPPALLAGAARLGPGSAAHRGARIRRCSPAVHVGASWRSPCFAACCRRSARRDVDVAACWATRAARRSRAGMRSSGCSSACRWRWPSCCSRGPGLLIRSFLELSRVDPGFEPSQILSFRVERDVRGLRGSSRATRGGDTRASFRPCRASRPRPMLGAGARGARRRLRFPVRASTEFKPLEGRDGRRSRACCSESRRIAELLRHDANSVGGGRALQRLPSKTRGSRPSVMVNSAFAARYFGGASPVGAILGRRR